MVSPQGRNTWTVDDLVPYVDKLVIISEEQERITEPVSHGPASEREFPAQEFHILQSSVETRVIGRRREPVEAEQYSQHMMERCHGMYYTPTTFSQYPSQMYQYPFEGHHTDTSASEHSFSGVAETQPHFSYHLLYLLFSLFSYYNLIFDSITLFLSLTHLKSRCTI